MENGKSIILITQTLQDAGLPWLLPNLRQDLVVWNALNDPAFLDQLLALHPPGAGLHPSDLSPSKLAAIAFDISNSTRMEEAWVAGAMINPSIQQEAVEANVRVKATSAVNELANAGTAALNWMDQHDATHSWASLLKAITEHPSSDWQATVACLFSLLDQPVSLLQGLVQASSTARPVELAVHAILSNPLTSQEQVVLLVDICHSPAGDALPASNRLMLLKSISAQRETLAAEFAARWLEVCQARTYPAKFLPGQLAEQVGLLLEDLFQMELRRQLGELEGLSKWLDAGLAIAHELHAGMENLALYQLGCQAAEKAGFKDASLPYQKAIQLCELAAPGHPYTRTRAELALLLAGQGRVEQASSLLPPNSALLPDDADLLYTIAQVRCLAGDTQQAWQAASRILAVLEMKSNLLDIPARGEGFSLLGLGQLLDDLKKPAEAAEVFQRALQVCPNDVELLRLLAASFTACHANQEASGILAALVAVNPGDLEDLRCYAHSLEEQNDWCASLEQRAKILAASQEVDSSSYLQDTYAYARSAIQAQQPELALKVAVELLNHNPEDSQALIYCGQAYLLLEENEKGMQCLEQATQIAPQQAAGWLALADAQKKSAPSETVIATLKQASQVAPACPEVRYALGQAYLEVSETTLALSELQVAVELAPQVPEYLVSYGARLHASGHLETARQIFSRAYALEPGFPGLAVEYAKILVGLGALEQAVDPFETLLQSRTTCDPSVYVDYANCILGLHRQGSTLHSPLKALAALNDVLQVNPAHAEAKALTAEALTANGEYELAFQAYREALDTPLRQDPSWFERLSLGLGTVASSLGRQDVAIAALQEAGKSNPHNPVIFTSLSDAYLAANLPEDALKAARSLLELDGEDPEHLAWFAYQVARLIDRTRSDSFTSGSFISKAVIGEALSSLQQAIQLAPARTDLLVQLGNFQASLGEQTAAQATFVSLASLDFATLDDLLSASSYLGSIGDHPSAIACLEKGISVDQAADQAHNPALYTRLAQEYLENQDPASAIQTLDRALEVLPGTGCLVSRKVEILLSLDQPMKALEVIQATCSECAVAEDKASLLLLASRIQLCMGNLPACIASARQGAELLAPSPGSTGMPALPVQYRAHLAEIYRALLQPEQAYQILQAEPMPERRAFSNEEDYLNFVFLQVELALETGESIHPDIQDIKLDTSHPYFSRLMAINARLLNKAGNANQAEHLFQLAYKKLSAQEPPPAQATWSSAHTAHLEQVALCEAAQDLGLWEQAFACVQQISQSAADEPLPGLELARGLVLQAEFMQLCSALGVARHQPRLDSDPAEIYNSALQALEQASHALGANLGQSILPGQMMSEAQIQRWQARAAIAFRQPLPPSVDPLDALLHAFTPGDIASAIQHLRNDASQDSEGEALSKMIKLARSFPHHPGVILPLALALQDSNPLEAVKTLQSVLVHNPYAHNPSIAMCNLQLARSALSVEEYSIAQEAVEKALDFWPDEPGWHQLAALVYRLTHAVGAIINHLQEAARLAPACFDCQQELGKILLEQASDDTALLTQAADCFEKALELEPGNVGVLLHLATTHYRLHNPNVAEQQARKAFELAPKRADILQLLSTLALERSDFQGAYEYAARATQASPQDTQSNIMLARALTAMGRHQEALAKLDAVIALVKETRQLHLERVNILRHVNGPQVALNELKSLNSAFPADFLILDALSKSFYEVSDLENAVAVAQQALDAHQEDAPPNEQASLHLLIGQALRQSGQLEASIQHLEQAVQLAPNRLEPYLELGLARKDRRDYQQALQVFERATQIAPQDPRAPFQAGLALKESKDYKSSETMLRRAVSLAPNDLAIRRQLAAVVALNLIHNPRSARINA